MKSSPTTAETISQLQRTYGKTPGTPALQAAGWTVLTEHHLLAKLPYTATIGTDRYWPEGYCELLDNRIAYHDSWGNTLLAPEKYQPNELLSTKQKIEEYRKRCPTAPTTPVNPPPDFPFYSQKQYRGAPMHPETLYRRLIYCRTLAYQIRNDLEMLVVANTDAETASPNNETYLHAWNANEETITNLNALIEKNAPAPSTPTPETEP